MREWMRAATVALPVLLAGVLITLLLAPQGHRTLAVAMTAATALNGLAANWYFIGRGEPGGIAAFVGLWARSIWVSAATGLLTYVLVALLALGGSDSSLIITLDSVPAAVGTPPVALAGTIWILGVAVVTILAIVVCATVLKRQRAFERAARTP